MPGGRKGDVFLVKNVAETGAVGWAQTNEAGDIGTNTYLKIPVVLSGTTANRPTSQRVVGQEYFDTTLGKPIWWKGSNWVDASQTPV